MNMMSEEELTSLIKQINLEELDASSWQGPSPTLDVNQDDGAGERIHIIDKTIQVEDSFPSGQSITIEAEAPVKLKVNGEWIEGDVNVTSTDNIQWEVEDQPLFELSVTEDKLVTDFQLISRERYSAKLEKVENDSTVLFKAVEDRDIVLEILRLDDVMAVIEGRSIKSHVDLAAIHDELENPTFRKITIAKGKKAVPGTDARLEVYFSEQIESHFFEIGGTVNFRNHLQIPSAKQGEVIARKIPVIEGIPGYDVYGNILLPDPPRDIMIIAKSTVEMTSEGEIIALREGRPRITGGKIKTFEISTSFVVSGNADIKTGNIVFSGDVIIYGDITEGMIVESLGNVYVYGSVYGSTVTATGSIYVKGNVIGSKLYSGYYGVMFNRLYQASKTLSDLLRKMLMASETLNKALESKKQSVRFGQILLLLIENKFREIPVVIKELLIVIANIQHFKKDEFQNLQRMSEMFIQPALLLENMSYNLLKGYLAYLDNTYAEVERMQENEVEIRINQCHNSELKSNGHISILGEGVLNSDLFSAGDISFAYESAVCRGSKLESGGSIQARIIGGQTGADTIMKAGKQISVTQWYGGRICIGKRCREIYDYTENRVFTSANV
ncbi:DUF342 domain-containing protein [Paenibacillus lemnae]|uniref:DUF342 domain-containing protein n=1 Tax=Paenibacillus lemnae TaxID=1330551 RepID=A0A848M2D0_PAELE|nr:FapA family protein [Paenibacillus lemnae]NMO95047.1 DUF342 domain-containing protein [Paenibacillus lemnae]